MIDLDLTRVVDPKDLASSSDFSLQEGEALTGWPVMTLARGAVVAENGKVIGKPGHGRFLAR